MKGKVKFYNEGKHFGFIAGDDGKEYFVHSSGLKDGVSLAENDSVEFDSEQGDRGLKAVNVRKAGAADEDTEAVEEGTEETTEEDVE